MDEHNLHTYREKETYFAEEHDNQNYERKKYEM